jgi:hypothetical protein
MTDNNVNLPEDVFGEILFILDKYRIKEEMKNGNNEFLKIHTEEMFLIQKVKFQKM